MAKPIYKRKWFIIVVVIVFLGIVGSAMGNDSDDNVQDNDAQKESPQTTQTDINKEVVNDEKEKDPEKVAEDTNAIDSKEMEETTIYKAGMYHVGSDISSGEYVIQAKDSAFGGYFEIAKDSSGDIESIIANDNISNNSYITVKDGEFLKMNGAVAIPVAEIEPFEPINGNYGVGMYKVGYDISPGEYKVIMKEDTLMGFGYYEITSDSRHTINSIVSNDNFENNAYINLKEGQYLKLNDAYIEAK